MPEMYSEELRHTDEIQDIITAPPSWLLRWGISVFFSVLLLIITLSSIISYPDLIKTQLTIRSEHPPISITGAASGSLSDVFFKENQMVKKGDILAKYETENNADDVIALLNDLKNIRSGLFQDKKTFISFPGNADRFHYGELQSQFQTFYMSYLTYKISISKKTLNADQLIIEKLRFAHSLDTFINEVDSWRNKYLVIAPISGKLMFGDAIGKGQLIQVGQNLFYINPVHSSFFGIVYILQNNIGKIRIGQRVLIKLRSYPFEEFGMLEGEIKSVGELVYKNGTFVSQVSIKEYKNPRVSGVKLRDGMLADADIITEEVSVFKRITQSLVKMFK